MHCTTFKLIMAAVRSRCGHYIFALWFLSSIFFYSSPNLSCRCGLSASLERRSETCCTRLAENTGCKKSPKSRHLGTVPQICRAISSQLRHVSTIGKKKLVKQPYLLNMSPQYGELGPLTAEIVLLVWGTPANFNGFRVLAALLYGTLVVGASQTLRHWTESATYIQQDGHHVGHWPTFLVFL